jgi:hypothetical protein
MDFTLVKEGEEEPISDSGHSDFYQRSVHLEVDLDEGNYIVYVRLDRILDRNEVRACLGTRYNSYNRVHE